MPAEEAGEDDHEAVLRRCSEGAQARAARSPAVHLLGRRQDHPRGRRREVHRRGEVAAHQEGLPAAPRAEVREVADML